jgi:acetyl esterase/lipase
VQPSQAAPEADILTRTSSPADVRIPYGPDVSQFVELRAPKTDGPHAVVLLIHGGFWRARFDLSHLGPLCEAFVNAGLATWAVEYRRVGESGGGWPGTFEDVWAACSKLATIAPARGLDASRVVAVGHSAGGHLALLLGASGKPLRGVVSLAGVADLRRAAAQRLGNGAVQDFLNGEPEEMSARYSEASPIERVPLGLPTILIHGTNDANVPFEQSARYHEAAQTAGDDVALVRLEGMGHFEPIDPVSDAWPAVLDAVKGLLG